MAHTKLEEAAGLTVADVVHRKFSALPADTTIGAVRDWFAASTSRRMAFLADDERYVGSLSREDVDGDLDPGAPAAMSPTPGRPSCPMRRPAKASSSRCAPRPGGSPWSIAMGGCSASCR